MGGVIDSGLLVLLGRKLPVEGGTMQRRQVGLLVIRLLFQGREEGWWQWALERGERLKKKFVALLP